MIWGIGPTFVFPSGTDKTLPQGKYSIGPTFVAVMDRGPWLIGVLINNVWSFAGKSNRPDFNQMLPQPFVNYNFPGGWYLTSSPIITANWEAGHGDRWTVPVGGGFRRVFKIGDQPVNAQFFAYYNVAKPTGAADWQLRAQVSFLFPEKASLLWHANTERGAAARGAGCDTLLKMSLEVLPVEQAPGRFFGVVP